MSNLSFANHVSGLNRCLADIAANLAYVRQELLALNVSAAVGAEVLAMRDEFAAALDDVRSEVRILEDKLGMHPDEDPFDPNVLNADPKATTALIEKWLRREIDSWDAMARRLDQEAKRLPELTALLVLLTESGANICNAFAEITERLKSIVNSIDSTPESAP
jgi:hypothetical protein